MDELQRELRRLERTLATADGHDAVIDELAAMRHELARSPDREPAFRLDSLRIASPCKERWADMTGDDRVRVCNGCDRPVFNLSEMTRERAEAVLAARGVTPCVRFYRRADGTVMTADCPTGARRKRPLAVVAAGTALLGASPALAEPTPPDIAAPTASDDASPTASDGMASDDASPTPADTAAADSLPEMGIIVCDPPARHSTIEWSTWIRGGYGVASRPPSFTARATSPEMFESSVAGEGALGAELTLSVARDGDLRIGGWAEMRTTSRPVLGAELIVHGFPRHPYRTWAGGLVVRGGGNGDVVTAAIGYGYTTADRWPGVARHATSVRMVSSMTRSVDDPHDWSVAIGVEFDPIGALGYLLDLGSRD